MKWSTRMQFFDDAWRVVFILFSFGTRVGRTWPREKTPGLEDLVLLTEAQHL